MGAASSTNFIDMTMSAMASVTNDYAAEAYSSGSATNNIYISGYETVVLNEVNQTATNTMTSTNMIDIIQNATVQQDLVNKIGQVAKSTVDGLALGSLSDSNNIVKASMSAAVTMLNKSSATCSSSASATNNFVAESTGQDNTSLIMRPDQALNQTATNSLVSECYLSALQSNSSVQSMKSTIDQRAEATVKGLDLMALFTTYAGMIIALACLGTVVVAGGMYFTGKVAMKYGILIAGVVLGIVGVYMIVQGTDEAEPMSQRSYSKMLTDFPACETEVLEEVSLYENVNGTIVKNDRAANAVAAGLHCRDTKECKAFQFKLGAVPELTGILTPYKIEITDKETNVTKNVINPTVTFFSNVNAENCPALYYGGMKESGSMVDTSQDVLGGSYNGDLSGYKDAQNFFEETNDDMFGVYEVTPFGDLGKSIVEYMNGGCGESFEDDQTYSTDSTKPCKNYKDLYFRPEGYVWVRFKAGEPRNADDLQNRNYNTWRLEKSAGKFVWVDTGFLDPFPKESDTVELETSITVNGETSTTSVTLNRAEWKSKTYSMLYASSFGDTGDNYLSVSGWTQVSIIDDATKEESNEQYLDTLLADAPPDRLFLDFRGKTAVLVSVRTTNDDGDDVWLRAGELAGTSLRTTNYCVDYPEYKGSCMNTVAYKRSPTGTDTKIVGWCFVILAVILIGVFLYQLKTNKGGYRKQNEKGDSGSKQPLETTASEKTLTQDTK